MSHEWGRKPRWFQAVVKPASRLNDYLAKKLPPEQRVEQKEESLARINRRYGEDSFRTTNAKANLASVLEAEGRLGEAIEIRRDVVDRFREHLGSGHHLTNINELALAKTLRDSGNATEAWELANRIVEAHQQDSGPDNAEVAMAKELIVSLNLRGMPSPDVLPAPSYILRGVRPRRTNTGYTTSPSTSSPTGGVRHE